MRLPKVLEATGLSKTAVYARARRGEFPSPVSIGPRTSAWVEEEVQEWIARRIAAARVPGTRCTLPPKRSHP